jgi:hypothetical protein
VEFFYNYTVKYNYETMAKVRVKNKMNCKKYFYSSNNIVNT